MFYTLLLQTLLLFSTTMYAMEVVYKHQSEQVRLITLNSKIYTLFREKKITEAQKLLPKDKDMEQFLMCSIKPGNSSYFKWILKTKKPLFNSRGIQKTLDYVIHSGNHEYIIILNQYIEKEKNKLELELDKTIELERLKIELYKAQQEFGRDTSSDKDAEVKRLTTELHNAQTEFNRLKYIKWDLQSSDSSESETDSPDCTCIIS
jgi:hypothetical protein